MSLIVVMDSLTFAAKNKGIDLGDWHLVGNGYVFDNGLTVSMFEVSKACSSINDILELVKVKLEGIQDEQPK